MRIFLNQEARKSGFRVLYGDGSRPGVLQSAGVSSPKAVMVMYTGEEKTIAAVQRIRLAFPAVRFGDFEIFIYVITCLFFMIVNC